MSNSFADIVRKILGKNRDVPLRNFEDEFPKLGKGITKKQMNKKEKNNPSEECSICLYSFKKNETIASLLCSHNFHISCITSWIKNALYVDKF
jgi:hypothetical protein